MNISYLSLKVYVQTWQHKHKNFLAILNNPQLLRNYEYIKKSEAHLEKFIFHFQQSLLNFIKSIYTLTDMTPMQIQMSLSDLEDELIYDNINTLSKTNLEYYPIKDKKLLFDKSSNYNTYTKNIPKNVKDKSKRNIFLPLYIKRSYLDKKIVRKFKLFIKKGKYDGNKIQNLSFWIIFSNENLLPPVRIEGVEYKSFNTNYLLWLFNKKGAAEMYEMFLKDAQFNTVLREILEYGKEDQDEKGKTGKLFL